jgi:uncharacterized paraquat-inducible protein A
MSNMKNKLAEYVEIAREAVADTPDERFEVNWLETTDEWVVNHGYTIIVDGLESEQEAESLLDAIEGELEAEMQEQVNDNGSMLNPDTVTYCNACHATEHKEVKACPECGSENVEHIHE